MKHLGHPVEVFFRHRRVKTVSGHLHITGHEFRFTQNQKKNLPTAHAIMSLLSAEMIQAKTTEQMATF